MQFSPRSVFLPFRKELLNIFKSSESTEAAHSLIIQCLRFCLMHPLTKKCSSLILLEVCSHI
jgi:hypothetical protein